MAQGHDIVVIGASAGGVEVLRTMVAGLPPGLDAAIFIVLHIPPTAPSVLPAILSRAGPLPALTATDGLEVRPGRIYIAPPDHHLLLRRGIAADSGRVLVVRGPRENGHRPAVDPLFRSAALHFGPRVVGVVLSGNLDDGAAGLAAVHAAGGITIVQDPNDALYPDMPRAAIRYAAVVDRESPSGRGVDQVCTAAELAHVLTLAVKAPVAVVHHHLAPEGAGGAGGHARNNGQNGAVMPGSIMAREDQMSAMEPSAMHKDDRPGSPSGYACPDCGGSLFELGPDELPRYRCRVGHAFGAESLLAAQNDGFENALWSALRALEEHATLLDRLAIRAEQRRDLNTASRFGDKARTATQHADTIRKLLLREPPASSGEPVEGNQTSVQLDP